MPKFAEDETPPRRCCKLWKSLLCSLIILFLLIGIFITCLTIKAYFFTKGFERITIDSNPQYLNLTNDEIKEQAERLSGAIKIPTVSTRDKNKQAKYLEAIEDLHKYIISTYPTIHQAEFIEKTVVSNYSLIYRVEGTSPNKSVYMLCGHLDVAPTPKRKFWDYEPFSGDIANEHRCSYCDTAFNVCEADAKEYVHGRGAIDTKNVVFGILEALENVLKNNSRPSRTFYIAFSHDEEIGGLDGSVQIKKEMKKALGRNKEILDFILDEGTVVIKDYFSFIKDPLIYISVAEIGWNKVKVEMNSATNYSVMDDLSMKKERCNQSWTLGGALRKLKNVQQPFRYGDGPECETFAYLSLYMNHFVFKLLSSNMWLFKVLISSGMVDASQVDINIIECKSE